MGGFKLPFIVLGSFVLATLPLAMLVLPKQEGKDIEAVVDIHCMQVPTGISIERHTGKKQKTL